LLHSLILLYSFLVGVCKQLALDVYISLVCSRGFYFIREWPFDFASK
jgi:hypothetical protein